MPSSLKNALIFYSRIPDEYLVGKSRIGKTIGNREIANDLARSLILDILSLYGSYSKKTYDIIFFHKGHRGTFVPPENCKIQKFLPQIEDSLPTNMRFVAEVLLEDYKKIIIIGSDIPLLHPKIIRKAFKKLNRYDVVLNPVEDGGYCLVGVKEPHNIYSTIENWDSHTENYFLYKKTLELIDSLGLKAFSLKKIFDIDVLEDVQKLWETITHNGELKKKFSYLPLTYKHILENTKIYRIS